jgi:hypothetical protein
VAKETLELLAGPVESALGILAEVSADQRATVFTDLVENQRVGAQIGGVAKTFFIDLDALSIEQDGIPNCGCSGIFEPECAEVGLTLANAMHYCKSMPEIAALLNRLKPDFTVVRACWSQGERPHRGESQCPVSAG